MCDISRWGRTKEPLVLAREVGLVVIADLQAGAGRIQPAPSIRRRDSCKRRCFWNYKGLIVVTALKCW